MKGIEGLPLQYILIIVVAVMIIGAIVGFMGNITGAVKDLGTTTATSLGNTTLKTLCDNALKIDPSGATCCKSCTKFGSNYTKCNLSDC